MTQQNVPLLSRVVLLYAMIIGVTLASMQIYSNLASTKNMLAMTPAVFIEKPVATQRVPIRLTLPSIRIDLMVVPGRYNVAAKAWDLSSDKAQYVTGTSPNLTMIYGHNTSAVFELTNSLHVGDKLVVQASNMETYTYHFVSDKITTPDDVSILTNFYNKPTIALLTCNGFWSQDRRFMFFEPIEEQL